MNQTGDLNLVNTVTFGLFHNASGFLICFDKLQKDYEIHLSGVRKWGEVMV